jgi:hypothetical protein
MAAAPELDSLAPDSGLVTAMQVEYDPVAPPGLDDEKMESFD